MVVRRACRLRRRRLQRPRRATMQQILRTVWAECLTARAGREEPHLVNVARRTPIKEIRGWTDDERQRVSEISLLVFRVYGFCIHQFCVSSRSLPSGPVDRESVV